MNEPDFEITDNWIISCRGAKNNVDPWLPYAFLTEKERTVEGEIEDTAIIFLTNRECPFFCLMCDLWKNTTNATVPSGAIPLQIRFALDKLKPARHLKLYNSGNFFDKKAIPEEDYASIADLISDFRTVIVESHPKLINDNCLYFRDMLKPDLQVAMGLEIANADILKKLNKKMTPDDFRKAAGFLKMNKIISRTFILLNPPFLTEEEGIYWAEKTIDFAFDCGTECCIIIPVRTGNGAMEKLAEKGYFVMPSLRSLERVLEYGISLGAGRVFADLWDIEKFSSCERCSGQRIKRLETMNFTQQISPQVNCSC